MPPQAARLGRLGPVFLRSLPGQHHCPCLPPVCPPAAGRDGNAFAWPGGELFLPLTHTPVADTTGAGDAFVAGLIAGLDRGDPPERAARLAVAAAGATVGHPGGRPALSPQALAAQLGQLPEPGDDRSGTSRRDRAG